MSAIAPSVPVAYLAPEIPALSATFVYEELLGLEKRGMAIVPISVRRPVQPAREQQALGDRTVVLYDRPAWRLALAGLLGLPRFAARIPLALRWLASDIALAGWTRPRNWKLAFQMLAAVRLASVLRERKCAHVHVHFAHVPAQIAMYAAALTGVPFTVTGHANDIFERGLLLPRKAARARRLLTISEYNRAYLESIGVDPHKLAVVRCGVSFEPATAGPAHRPGGPYRIGTLGRLVEKKGVDVLVRAVAELVARGMPVELSVVGDGPMRPGLEALVTERGLEESVRFGGSLPHGEVAQWMQGLSAFVLASKPDAQGDMDGIPVVLMEAMSQGIPVVSSRLSGIPELVRHEETGLLAEPGDPVDLARQIERLLASTELRETMVERARAHVTSEFGRELNLDRLLGHFGLEG
jgi:glycosyltransferase involved in cell wall biosynthesis